MARAKGWLRHLGGAARRGGHRDQAARGRATRPSVLGSLRHLIESAVGQLAAAWESIRNDRNVPASAADHRSPSYHRLLEWNSMKSGFCATAALLLDRKSTRLNSS